jgi:hypothetical protein
MTPDQVALAVMIDIADPGEQGASRCIAQACCLGLWFVPNCGGGGK